MLVFIHVLHFEVCHSIVTCSLLIRLTDNWFWWPVPLQQKAVALDATKSFESTHDAFMTSTGYSYWNSYQYCGKLVTLCCIRMYTFCAASLITGWVFANVYVFVCVCQCVYFSQFDKEGKNLCSCLHVWVHAGTERERDLRVWIVISCISVHAHFHTMCWCKDLWKVDFAFMLHLKSMENKCWTNNDSGVVVFVLRACCT